MKDVIELIDRARLRSASLNDELEDRFGTAQGDPPIGGLNMVNQYAIVTLELLSYYHNLWGSLSPSAVADPERARQENAERVIMITKAAFSCRAAKKSA